jgi:hypothetical protein
MTRAYWFEPKEQGGFPVQRIQRRATPYERASAVARSGSASSSFKKNRHVKQFTSFSEQEI